MDPFLFFQTKQEKVDLKKIISLMELIWIRHIKKIPHDSENEEIETAKKIFFQDIMTMIFLIEEKSGKNLDYLQTFGIAVAVLSD